MDGRRHVLRAHPEPIESLTQDKHAETPQRAHREPIESLSRAYREPAESPSRAYRGKRRADALLSASASRGACAAVAMRGVAYLAPRCATPRYEPPLRTDTTTQYATRAAPRQDTTRRVALPGALHSYGSSSRCCGLGRHATAVLALVRCEQLHRGRGSGHAPIDSTSRACREPIECLSRAYRGHIESLPRAYRGGARRVLGVHVRPRREQMRRDLQACESRSPMQWGHPRRNRHPLRPEVPTPACSKSWGQPTATVYYGVEERTPFAV